MLARQDGGLLGHPQIAPDRELEAAGHGKKAAYAIDRYLAAIDCSLWDFAGRALDRSLQRLRLEPVDLWLLHHPGLDAIESDELFAFLEAFGEVGVGLGLTLGVLTSFSALVGLLMSINFFLAMQWMGFCQQGFHLVLAGCMLAFLIGRAGRSWGLDALILKRWNSRWLQRLL